MCRRARLVTSLDVQLQIAAENHGQYVSAHESWGGPTDVQRGLRLLERIESASDARPGVQE